MFAYCGNNPIAFSDSGGSISQVCFDDQFNHMRMPWQDGPTGGKSSYSMIKASGPANPWISKMIYDYVMNSDEQVVFDSKHFSFFKGRPVVKVSDLDAGFSFFIIFIDADTHSKDLLLHEYGHTVQLLELGLLPYIYMVLLPSVSCFWLSKVVDFPDNLYYSLPWEYKADEFGNVNWGHMPWAPIVSDTYYWPLSKIVSHMQP